MAKRIKTIEEALSLAGFAHYNLYLFLFYGWLVITMTFEMFGTFYLMPAMAKELGATESQLGLIPHFLTGGLSGSSNIWCYMADTRGRKIILQIALIVSFASAIGAAFSPHWIVFVLFKMASAAGVAGIFAASFPLLTECTPIATRRAVIVLTTSTLMVALGTVAVLSFSILSLQFSGYIPGLHIYFNSWRLLCLIFALPAIFGALGVRYVFESPKYLLTVDKELEALEVLRGIHEINNRRNAHTYQVDMLMLDEENISTRNMSCLKSYWTRMRNMLKKPRMRYFITVMKALICSYVCAYCYIELTPIIASAFMTSRASGNTHLTVCEMVRHHQNTTGLENNDILLSGFAMTMMFAIGIALAVLNIFMNGLISYVSRKRVILGIQVMVTIAAACINFSPYGVLTAILYMCVISGVFNLGLLYTYVPDIFPTFILFIAVSLTGVAGTPVKHTAMDQFESLSIAVCLTGVPATPVKHTAMDQFESLSIAVCLTAVAGLGPASFAAMFIKKLIRSNCEVVFYIVTGVSLACIIFIIFLPSDETLVEKRKVLEKVDPEVNDDET